MLVLRVDLLPCLRAGIFFACIPLNASLTGLGSRLKRFNGVLKLSI
nr:MAG TPA: hypothetical protein [Caudoviricetes sp.]